MKKTILGLAFGLIAAASTPLLAADYVIDHKGAHASINFKISHLGFSWLTGRFNSFGGNFSYDENNPNASKVVVDIDPASIDSNQAKRDKHIRSDDFLDVKRFPKARFESTSFTESSDGSALIKGNLTLHGVTKEITINATKVGAGNDPWKGYRMGFAGSTSFALQDFDIDQKGIIGLGPKMIELSLHVEGIRQ
ncbi:MAG: YceI family protein [Motiliproteus sp.]